MRHRVVSGFLFGMLLIGTAAMAAVGAGAPAQAADFYAGKTITFIVGADAAGGYDVYARVIARHLSRFIPGNPTIVVENMPGAGSGKAASYIYNVAPRDGTTIAALFPGVMIDPLLQQRATGQYDPTKFTYLASADSDPRICVTGPSSKITTFEQTLNEKTIIGASQSGGSTSDYAYMIKNATGAKLDIVSGYKGTATIMLAIERGEAEGVCGLDWSSFKTQRPQWLHDRTAHVIVQAATGLNAELAALDVPNFETFVKDDLDKKAVDLVVSQQIFSRPYVAPPGVPAEQAKILRDAFAAVLHDKQFLADAQTANLSINPSTGETVADTVTKLYAAPAEVVQRARQLIASPDVRQ
jgi:tripartite-type tricarboxylate transporter receptor subunit TctC